MTRPYLEAGVSTPKARAPISNKLLVIDFWRLYSVTDSVTEYVQDLL